MVRSHSLYPIELRGLQGHSTAENLGGNLRGRILKPGRTSAGRTSAWRTSAKRTSTSFPHVADFNGIRRGWDLRDPQGKGTQMPPPSPDPFSCKNPSMKAETVSK